MKKAPLKRTTISAIGLKRKAPEDSGPKKRTIVTPSGNLASRSRSSIPSTRPSPSYTIVGMRKPGEGYGKALMSKPKPPPKEQTETSSQMLRIKQFKKLPPIRWLARQRETSDEEDMPPKGPTISSLSSENLILREHIRGLNDSLAENLIKIRALVDDMNSLCFKMDQKIAKLARAAGVADVLDQPY